jgi:N-acetylglucosaminyldiphosphoundecaprenol N-acetyl-beta-D-mannosaminyltransferase
MSRQNTYDKLGILGVDIDILDLHQAVNFIIARATQVDATSGYVIKPYVEFFDRASSNASLQDLLNHSQLAIADGVAVQWAAHYLYAGPRTLTRFFVTLFKIILAPSALAWPVPERAAGTNFTWLLLNAAASSHLKVFLVGKKTPREIQAVADVIQREIPGIQVSGTSPGYDSIGRPGSVGSPWFHELHAKIQSATPDLVLIGMGFPLQERICAELSTSLTHGVCIGEGGTFDYESFGGQRRKAPAAVQRVGLEWLWRLILEPSRWRRQLAIPRFIVKVWRSSQ